MTKNILQRLRPPDLRCRDAIHQDSDASPIPSRWIGRTLLTIDNEEPSDYYHTLKERQTSSVCDLCGNLHHQWRGLSRFDFDLPALEASAQRGCESCGMIRDGIQHFEFDWKDSTQIAHGTVWGYSTWSSLISCDVYFQDARPHLRLQFRKRDKKQLWRGPVELVPANATDSEETISWAQNVFRNCVESHSNKDPKVSFLPRRVLDLEAPSLATSQPGVRLYEPNESEEGHYATLSHCWGNTRSIKAETTSLKKLKERIEWDELPKTFQDAIRFTRRLGLRYLWIDSLCILQDDTGDWHREAAKMAVIFRNSTITLAATRSPNDQEGFYAPKLPISSSITGAEVSVHRLFSHWDEEDASQLILEYPLRTRGWAYQELLLSPRVFHFCECELLFDCQHAIRPVCQCSSGVSKARPNYLTFHKGTIEALRHRRLGHQGQDMFKFHYERVHAWHTTIQDFSALDLSFESDRLPAISGLADEFQVYFKGAYLAGLWEDTLDCDLQWRVPTLTDVNGKGRANRSNAPSWSWASVNSAVDFPSPIHSRCKWPPTGVSIPRHRSFAKGQVKGGYVNVKGKLIQASVEYSEQADGSVNPLEYKVVILETRYPFFADYKLFDDEEDGNHIPNLSTVFCIDLLVDNTEEITALVLRPVDYRRRIFQRIGIMNIPKNNEPNYQETDLDLGTILDTQMDLLQRDATEPQHDCADIFEDSLQSLFTLGDAKDYNFQQYSTSTDQCDETVLERIQAQPWTWSKILDVKII